MAPIKSQNSNMLLAFLTLLGVIAIVAVVGFFMLRKGPEIIQGQAEVTEYRVSSKVPGRILEFRVKEGQRRHTKCGKKPRQALPLPRNHINASRISTNRE